MALANFFDKTTLAASQILKGVSASDFRHRLAKVSVCLSIGAGQSLSSEARVCVEIATNLLSRFYPTIAFDLGPDGRDLEISLRSLASAINLDIEFGDAVNSAYVLSIGNGRPAEGAKYIHFGSDDWIATVSLQNAIHCGKSENVIGAAAAGCLAVASLFGLVFSEELQSSIAVDSEINLLEYDSEQKKLSEFESDNVDLGIVHLVGCGAVGNAALWTLARCKWLGGTIHVIDPETVDLSNLQRYVLCVQSDVSQQLPKVEVARRVCESLNSRLDIHAHAESWSEFAHSSTDYLFDRVAVAVDSAKARREAQVSLPREVINAWTGSNGDVGVSRHMRFGHDACLVCLYLPAAETKNFDQIVAESLHVSNIMQIRKLLHSGELLTEQAISQIATLNGVPAESLSAFIGKPLITFYNEAVCGGILFRLGGNASPEVEVPMAFQSAFAGIMLAAEIVCRAIDPHCSRKTTTRLNLLRAVPDVMSFNIAQNTTGRCICADPDFLTRYREKYKN